jgi:Asp-tRNA(Asn)/Glu-tRNA(Gln) amidotransferase A subunit family amidase
MKFSAFSSIAEITSGLRTKEFSASEVLAAHLEQIRRLQPKLNAFTHLDESSAVAQASAAGAKANSATSRGAAPLPLDGVPLTIKSCIDVAQWPCPAGSLLRKNYHPACDAPVVERLKAAGAILLGNTSAPENLMAYETDNALQGKTSNPWSLEKSSGGSSGGEAAAIAAGCSAGGVGSDGGGSIRVPAHFCGICGLKPTPGSIPATGHFPSGDGAFPWLGVVGPMARNVADVRTLFEVLRGPDPGDALAIRLAPRVGSKTSQRGLRIGVLETDALGSCTTETTAAIRQAADNLESLGFHVEHFRLPEILRALELWWFFFGTIVAHLFRQSLTASDEPSLSPQFREYLSAATSPQPPSLDEFLSACTERDRLRAKILRRMADVPVLLSQVSAAPAFAHGEGTWLGPTSYRETMRASQWLNLTGFPGISVPVTFSSDGLPIGIQLIGRPHEEDLLLDVAAAIEQARGPWPEPPPFA